MGQVSGAPTLAPEAALVSAIVGGMRSSRGHHRWARCVALEPVCGCEHWLRSAGIRHLAFYLCARGIFGYRVVLLPRKLEFAAVAEPHDIAGEFADQVARRFAVEWGADLTLPPESRTKEA